MQPSNRRQAQMESSRGFRALMLKMVGYLRTRILNYLVEDFVIHLVVVNVSIDVVIVCLIWYTRSDLTTRMFQVRVETERDYEELWKEYNKELLGEPFLPKKFKVEEEINFSMTPEFSLIVREKENEVNKSVNEETYLIKK